MVTSKGGILGHDDSGGQDCSNRYLGDARDESSGHYNNIHAVAPVSGRTIHSSYRGKFRSFRC